MIYLCKFALFLPALLLASHAYAQKLPDAATILDRYVQVTGGADAYRPFAAEVSETTVTPENGPSFDQTIARARTGERKTEVENGPQSGVHNGAPWRSSKTGATLLTGKAAARELALIKGFTPETWRLEFPHAQTEREEVLNGSTCYRLKLTRTDGSTLVRFFDKQTGLLVRELSTEFDENGTEHPVTLDITSYGTWQSIKHPSALHIQSEGHNRSIKIVSVEYTKFLPPDAFLLPHEAIRAFADSQNASPSFPSAVALLDRYIEVTGGKDAYDSIKSQHIQAEVNFQTANLKAPLVAYAAARGKQYMSFDIPGAGKFETGSDGSTAWERSVVLGPRLLPRSQVNGTLGANWDQLLQWMAAFASFKTVALDTVNGKPCYVVSMQAKPADPPTTTCFDAATGYMTRMTTKIKSEQGEVSADVTLSDYRLDGPLRSAHHLETKMGGMPVTVEITQLAINTPLPAHIFDLPEDVQALKQKRSSHASDPADRPSLLHPR